MAPHYAARLRLLALGVAVFARTGAYVAVTVVALKALLIGDYASYRPSTLAAWLGFSAIPALVLVPIIGSLAASRWNRTIMLAGAVLMVAVLGLANAEPDIPWLSLAGMLSLEAAFFWSAAWTLVPTVANAAPWRQPNVAVLLLSAAAVGLTLVVRLTLDGVSASDVARSSLAAALLALIGIALARFPLAEPVSLASSIVRPFVAGLRDVLRSRLTCSALLGCGLWFFITLTVFVALVRLPPAEAATDTRDLTIRFAIGLAIGVMASGLNRNLYRHGGITLFGAVAAVVFAIWIRSSASWSVPFLGLGISLGAAISPLVGLALFWTVAKARGVAASLIVAGACLAALFLAAVLVNLGDDPVAARSTLLTILVVVTCAGALGALLAFFRPALEVAAEVVISPIYRVEGTGPGLEQVPLSGPCLVIANHAAWFDPLFLAKVLPRPITPMMTSRFYDLPVLSWIMRNIIGTIRVPEKSLRHEAPELKEAVAALDRGACIILFPEGYLRRKEEQPIRRFGRGVWQILRDRPDTPVFAGWIDGNWGSYFSYKDGPPTKNKRFDFWRRIRVALTGPLTVDRKLLDDHMATRAYLMRKVSDARTPLGLEPLPLDAVADEEKE